MAKGLYKTTWNPTKETKLYFNNFNLNQHSRMIVKQRDNYTLSPM